MVDDDAAKFDREDLRMDCTAAIELSRINEVCSHLEQEKSSHFPSKNGKKEPKIGEVVIPSHMRRWDASLSGLTAFLPPTQRWRMISLSR